MGISHLLAEIVIKIMIIEYFGSLWYNKNEAVFIYVDAMLHWLKRRG